MVNGFRTTAQVLPQDSLALVAFYNSTDGAHWYNNTNWLSTRVGLWEGIAIVGNRVQTLALGNNNVAGTIPVEFCDLSGLEYIYLNKNQLTGNLPSCIGNAVSINSIDLSDNALSGAFPSVFATAMPHLADIWISNNQYTDFPDLAGVAELSNLHVEGNNLTFEDIVPNTLIPNLGYVYSPQTTIIQSGPDVILSVFDPFTLQVTIGGTNNTYQWQATFQNITDNSHVSGATSSVLYNNGARVADAGFYSCLVSNPGAPLLTIRVVSSRVEVTDNRLPQSLPLPVDTSVYCGIDSIIFPSASNVLLPLSYQALSNGFIASNEIFYPYSPGVSSVRVFNDGDTTHLPLDETIAISVLTHQSIPSFSIENDLPIYEGEELTLTVQDITGVIYSWTTPDFQNEQTSSITRSAGSPLLEGVYKVRISEGTCLYDSLRITVSLSVDSNIVIYELITPNGDGDNETFYIKNIEALPSVHVTIFNVWHQVLYNKDSYKNDWDGGGLPVGTYYYLVKVEEWDKEYKGNLYIKR
ncbi:MAG: large protein [Chitinophagaceae bacterium]|nr:large protein [Chitinophagaceae bacterium]